MPQYDAANFDPPAPVTSVTLRKVGDEATASGVVLLIDSGADVTLLPRMAVERIGVQQIEGLHYEMMAFDGTKSAAPVADLLQNRRGLAHIAETSEQNVPVPLLAVGSGIGA